MTLYFTLAFTSFPILEENFAEARFPFQDVLLYFLILLVGFLALVYHALEVLLCEYLLLTAVHTNLKWSICLCHISCLKNSLIFPLYIPLQSFLLCSSDNAFDLSIPHTKNLLQQIFLFYYKRLFYSMSIFMGSVQCHAVFYYHKLLQECQYSY